MLMFLACLDGVKNLSRPFIQRCYSYRVRQTSLSGTAKEKSARHHIHEGGGAFQFQRRKSLGDSLRSTPVLFR